MHEDVQATQALIDERSAAEDSLTRTGELLSRFAPGQVDALAARAITLLTTTYERMKPKLIRFVESRVPPRLRGRIDVEGVLHSALLRLVRNFSVSRPESDEQMCSWLYKKVWSELHDEIRRFSTDGRDIDREIPLPEDSVADLANRIGVSTSVGLKDVVARIRQVLGPVEFEIVRMKILDELTFADIGEVLGATPDAVRKRYVRSLLKVRQTIADPFGSSGSA
jgi:RNA polymerase sigma factor (sigma-70 family)